MTKPKLKLAKGLWIRRDGVKQKIEAVNSRYGIGFNENGEPEWWYLDGSLMRSGDHPCDIVSKWMPKNRNVKCREYREIQKRHKEFLTDLQKRKPK